VIEDVSSPQADPLPHVPISGQSVPSIFGVEDSTFMQSAARGLAEPEHAMVNTPFAVAAESIAVELPEPTLLQPISPFALWLPMRGQATEHHHPPHPSRSQTDPARLIACAT